jgi:hypothetical protein
MAEPPKRGIKTVYTVLPNGFCAALPDTGRYAYQTFGRIYKKAEEGI